MAPADWRPRSDAPTNGQRNPKSRIHAAKEGTQTPRGVVVQPDGSGGRGGPWRGSERVNGVPEYTEAPGPSPVRQEACGGGGGAGSHGATG